MGDGQWLRLVRSVLCGLLAPLFFTVSGLAASATITAVDQGNGGVLVTATGTFDTCTYCDANGKNCSSTSNGSIAAYLNGGLVCSRGGSGSATCTATLDRGSLHGPHSYSATASDCKGNSSAGTSTNFDNTPSITVTGPSGTVTGPFDITGTATFKPTLNATKGFIRGYVNGSFIGDKSCSTEICSYSYKELTSKLYDMNHGGPYTITMTAYGGGTSATATGSFSVNKTPTVSVTAPAGNVRTPFDIIGKAQFKPTTSTTKGSMTAYINGGYVGSKSCTMETCSFSYKEITGNLYTLPPGQSYTVKLTASGGGSSASDEKSFFVEDLIPDQGCPEPAPDVSSCCNK